MFLPLGRYPNLGKDGSEEEKACLFPAKKERKKEKGE